MTFLSRIVRLLFWVLVVSWSVALLRRLIGWGVGQGHEQSVSGQESARTTTGQAAQGHKLHRDPLCGTHISEEISFPLREAGETLHFCSAECRDDYAGTLRRAANA